MWIYMSIERLKSIESSRGFEIFTLAIANDEAQLIGL